MHHGPHHEPHHELDPFQFPAHYGYRYKPHIKVFTIYLHCAIFQFNLIATKYYHHLFEAHHITIISQLCCFNPSYKQPSVLVET